LYWIRRMPRSQSSVHVKIAGHLAIGVALGAVLALVLLLSSDPPILRLILNGSSPALALALYIGVFVMTFGLGSTLTGLLFEDTDEQ
jgi:hypothetical protein